MAYPPSLTTITVRGTFQSYPDGAPAKGSVLFKNAEWLQGPTDDVIIAPFEAKTSLDATGRFSVALPATNDPQWSPAGWTYTVSIAVNGKTLKGSLALPVTGPAVVDLADVLNRADPTPRQFYLVASAAGAPGGVAQLGPDGKVPVAQLPSRSTEPVDWADLQHRPTTFPPAPHSHLVADVGGLDTALAGKADISTVAALSAAVSGLTKILVLGQHDPVPSGTPAGTVIVRTTS